MSAAHPLPMNRRMRAGRNGAGGAPGLVAVVLEAVAIAEEGVGKTREYVSRAGVGTVAPDPAVGGLTSRCHIALGRYGLPSEDPLDRLLTRGFQCRHEFLRRSLPGTS